MTGVGDDVDAVDLRRKVENLFECDITELTIDLAELEDAGPLFLRILSDLVVTAQSRHCALSITGVRSPLLLEALHDAPLDQLLAVYRASCLHRRTS
jgi:anti-anti-sigma regulatory factor